jgi:hypothetical protein
MSYSISTLLTRNLHDVFGENDPARRRAAIVEIFTEDCVFYEPRGVYRGRDEIDRVAGAIKATHPDFRYQPIAGTEELGNGARIRWLSGRPGEAPAYAGTDFIIARDGRIAAVYRFFSTSYRHLCDEHQRRDGQHDAGCLRGVVYQRLKELGQHHRGREDDRTYQAARIPAPRSTTIVLAANFADARLTVLQGSRGIFGDVLSRATPRK